MQAAAAGSVEGNPSEKAALMSAARSLPTATEGSDAAGRRGAPSGAASDGGDGEAAEADPDPASRTGALQEVYWQVTEGNEDMLWEVKPSFVVLVDPQVAVVRQLEVFRAYHPGHPLRVYFLYYSKSSEKQKYLSALEREIKVFDSLINMKGYLMTPSAQSLSQVALPQASPYHPGAEPSNTMTNAITRRANNAPDKGPQTVVVDIREFVSSLPAVLHQRGIDVKPVTLEVGDYILTPDICVERKAIPDLIQSLHVGALRARPLLLARESQSAPVLAKSIPPIEPRVGCVDV
mmetsp:Transcript_46374/g.115976  ORF Transcript_46374/g.115976 Transcript_46374/m.115976 type:complete len:292 (+) Transcript_46374:192-1067(+)